MIWQRRKRKKKRFTFWPTTGEKREEAESWQCKPPRYIVRLNNVVGALGGTLRARQRPFIKRISVIVVRVLS